MQRVLLEAVNVIVFIYVRKLGLKITSSYVLYCSWCTDYHCTASCKFICKDKKEKGDHKAAIISMFQRKCKNKPEPKLVFRLATSFLFSFACFPHPFKCRSGFLLNSWCEREHGSPRFLQTLLILLSGSPFCAVSQLRLSEGFYTPTESPIWTFWPITCHSLTPWGFGSRVWSNRRSLTNGKRMKWGTRKCTAVQRPGDLSRFPLECWMELRVNGVSEVLEFFLLHHKLC